MERTGEGATNPAARAAVEAFAAAPGAKAVQRVLAACLTGHLLLDGTGSNLTTADGAIQAGSTLTIAGGAGPDGGRALYAFTSHAEIRRMHPGEEDSTVSFVQPAVGVLELVGQENYAWLYVDPAGPTVGVRADEIAFALRVPRNDRVRAALEPGVPRAELLAALAAPGELIVHVAGGDAGPPTVVPAPDGGTALLVATSGPDALATQDGNQVQAYATDYLVGALRANHLAGMVINPAGPSAFVPVAELPG